MKGSRLMVHKKLGGASLALAAAIALSGCVSIGSKPPQLAVT
jgi:cholesterol transport system auxiliary component